MNPRAGATGLLVFEARPFSHLGTPPKSRYVQYFLSRNDKKVVNSNHYTKYFQKCK